MESSNISNILFQQLNFRAEKQKIISSNIANINTPNYKTKDLVFEDELNNATNMLSLEQTNSRHMNLIGSSSSENNQQLIEVSGLQEQNDGNNVNLDSEISKMSKNKVLFDAIQSSIKKDSRLFRSVIESSAKN